MISKSAHICEGAKLGKDVTVEPFAYIAADVEIGDGCWIGPGAVILDGARLGKNCKVHTAAGGGGETALAFSIATILMVLTLLINLTAGIIGRKLKRK